MRPSRALATVLTTCVLSYSACARIDARAQDTDMKRAHEASQSARAFKRRGDLANAEKMFRIVTESAPETTTLHREAEDELAYYIPLLRIQRLLWEGNAAAAEQALLDLQLEVGDQPFRRQQINRILHGLRTATLDAGDPAESGVDERTMMRHVRAALERYYREHQRYPADRAALSEVLAFDQPPLAGFDIARYASDGEGYLLILHDMRNPDHTLTLHNVGRMQ